ncbi:MAG: 23S rRNA (pseudouridine(1915)-N(3))-methyltransferase RlmH [bacterium]
MKLLLLPIGKPRSKPIVELASDYSQRLSHYVPFEIMACRDDRQALARVEPGDFFVLMDQRGGQMSSEQVAEFIQAHQMRGTRRMVFFIGGPDGAGDEIRKRADQTLGLSPMTFPHELVQVILLEQLYRAFTILKREPYHK